jgi:signal transduction histidine kinase
MPFSEGPTREGVERMARKPGLADANDEPAGLSAALLMHGLWQPVATLHALSLALTRGWATLDEAERLRLATDIEAETGRLREVAEDLTMLSLIQADGYRPPMRRETVVDLLRDAAAAVDELGGRLRVRVEPSVAGGVVMGDRGRLLRVLKAFLLRADRSSDGGGIVTLRARRDGDGVTFAVEYRGTAVPPRDAFELEPSDRAERPRRRAGSVSAGAPVAAGSGRGRLSMYVSRCLVEAHGGRVEARSSGDVVTLAFVLPVAESEAA